MEPGSAFIGFVCRIGVWLRLGGDIPRQGIFEAGIKGAILVSVSLKEALLGVSFPTFRYHHLVGLKTHWSCDFRDRWHLAIA